jgi:hypothetical protein
MFGVDRRVKKEMVFCICFGREEREGWVRGREERCDLVKW